MKRSYRGPIIERGVERGFLRANDHTQLKSAYALAIDERTGRLTLLFELLDACEIDGEEFESVWEITSEDPSQRRLGGRRLWTVTP